MEALNRMEETTYRIIYTTPNGDTLSFKDIGYYEIDEFDFISFTDSKTGEVIYVPKDRVMIKKVVQ